MSPKGKRLELDGYNVELCMAFEYQGEQHDRFSERFHKTQEYFEYRRANDLLKVEMCQQRGIKLLVVPYMRKGCGWDSLKKLIAVELDRHHIAYDKTKLWGTVIKQTSPKSRQYEKLHNIVTQHGGKVLSEYITSQVKVLFECRHSHQWWAIPNSIMQGSWCKLCHNQSLRRPRA